MPAQAAATLEVVLKVRAKAVAKLRALVAALVLLKLMRLGLCPERNPLPLGKPLVQWPCKEVVAASNLEATSH